MVLGRSCVMLPDTISIEMGEMTGKAGLKGGVFVGWFGMVVGFEHEHGVFFSASSSYTLVSNGAFFSFFSCVRIGECS